MAVETLACVACAAPIPLPSREHWDVVVVDGMVVSRHVSPACPTCGAVSAHVGEPEVGSHEPGVAGPVNFASEPVDPPVPAGEYRG